ncbi:hypothetical protein ACOQFO_00950 [Ureibacillus sp. MALMAid1270]|uniref:hypothetical protein n=1 Tax=Ureibacillus TaxID=160795 RepID=UPI0030C900A7
MDFLYFPEDKTEYLPVIFELLVLLILCFIVFNLIRRISKKQELKAKEIEERILLERQHLNAPSKTEE